MVFRVNDGSRSAYLNLLQVPQAAGAGTLTPGIQDIFEYARQTIGGPVNPGTAQGVQALLASLPPEMRELLNSMLADLAMSIRRQSQLSPAAAASGGGIRAGGTGSAQANQNDTQGQILSWINEMQGQGNQAAMQAWEAFVQSDLGRGLLRALGVNPASVAPSADGQRQAAAQPPAQSTGAAAAPESSENTTGTEGQVAETAATPSAAETGPVQESPLTLLDAEAPDAPAPVDGATPLIQNSADVSVAPAADAPPGTYTMPPVGPSFAGSLYRAEDLNNQPFSTGADFFDPRPENVQETMGLARAAIQQGREPIISLHSLILDENKSLRPDAPQVMEQLKAEYPDVMLRPGAVFEAVDEVFWNKLENGQPGTGSDERIRQAADDTIAALDFLHQQLPDARLAVSAPPEVWRGDLHSLNQGNPAVVPEFKRILEHMRPGDIASTDPYAWTTDPHDQEIKLQAAREFNDFVRANAPDVQTALIPQGFLPSDLAKPADQWTPEETRDYANFLDRMFTIARDYDRTVVWGGATALDGLSPVTMAPREIQDLYQRWAQELGGPPSPPGTVTPWVRPDLP